MNWKDFDGAHAFDPDVPAFVSEGWTGWFAVWGSNGFYDQYPSNLTDDLRFWMDNKYSFNFYVIHGGTNFGGTSGGSGGSGGEYFEPYITSYDYGAPINERGMPSNYYENYRDIIQSYLAEPLIDIPKEIPSMTVAPIEIK